MRHESRPSIPAGARGDPLDAELRLHSGRGVPASRPARCRRRANHEVPGRPRCGGISAQLRQERGPCLMRLARVYSGPGGAVSHGRCARRSDPLATLCSKNMVSAPAGWDCDGRTCLRPWRSAAVRCGRCRSLRARAAWPCRRRAPAPPHRRCPRYTVGRLGGVVDHGQRPAVVGVRTVRNAFSGLPSRSNGVVQDSTVPTPSHSTGRCGWARGRPSAWTSSQRNSCRRRGGAVDAEAVLGQVAAVGGDQAARPRVAAAAARPWWRSSA